MGWFWVILVVVVWGIACLLTSALLYSGKRSRWEREHAPHLWDESTPKRFP